MSYPRDFFERWFPGEPCPTGGFHDAVARHLPVHGKLLDFGCGNNELLSRFRTDKREVWGADFDRHPDLKHAEWFRLLEPDGSLAFADQTFDVVCSHMVMEHVSDPAAFFAEVMRVLKPHGVYVGHSIHARHYVTWIRRLFDLVPHRLVQRLVKNLYGREEHDTFPTRYRLNSRRAIGRVADQSQLHTIGWETYANQGYFVFSPLLFRLAVVCDWGLEKLSPDLGRIYFTVVLQKPAATVAPRRALAA